jgi:sugar phosphate isomerase/epimerase
LDILSAAGAEAVEVVAAQPHFDYTSRQAIRELADYFAGSPLKFHSVHGPMYRNESSTTNRERNNVVHRERSERIAAMDDIKRAIEVAELAPFRFLVLHLDEYNEPWSDAILDLALTAVEHLQAFARPLGVKLAVENLWNDVTQPQYLIYLLETGHFKDAGICFDSGHALIVATQRARARSGQYAEDGSVLATREDIVAEYMAMLEQMAPRILTTHLHDNDGTRDAHLWPGDESLKIDATGSHGVPWAQTMAVLRGAANHPACNLELHSSFSDDVKLERRARAAFEFLLPS